MTAEQYGDSEPVISGSLLLDIIKEKPLLLAYLYEPGINKDNVSNAGKFVLGVFGKCWYVRTEEYEKAGLYRDLQKISAETGIAKREFTDVDATAMSEIVTGMFTT
jgi:hypothetical protein